MKSDLKIWVVYQKMLSLIPGLGGQIKEDMLPDDKQLGRIEAIIYSMTKEEEVILIS